MIPAASLHGVDFDRLKGEFPREAQEIELLGERMTIGDDSDEEFIRLCTLLYQVGEQEVCEGLLRANCVVGDETHELYKTLFGNRAEAEFRTAIVSFANQFSIELQFKSQLKFLQEEYTATLSQETKMVLPIPIDGIHRHCEVLFTYEDKQRIGADVLLADSDSNSGWVGVPFNWDGSRWRLIDPTTWSVEQ